MIYKYAVLFVLFLPVLVWTQSDSESLEAAKLGLIEKIYERGAEHYRKQLAGRGLTSDEVENILFEAIDAYASCIALAAQAQAHEQGLSEEIILKGFGRRTRGKEESLVLLELDMDALNIRTAPCKKALGDKLGIIIL